MGLFLKKALQKRLYSAKEIIFRSLLIVATPYQTLDVSPKCHELVESCKCHEHNVCVCVYLIPCNSRDKVSRYHELIEPSEYHELVESCTSHEQNACVCAYLRGVIGVSIGRDEGKFVLLKLAL